MSFTPTDYNPYDFANRRHIGPSPVEMEEMLAATGVRSLDELIEQTVPASIRQSEPLGWAPLAEHELLAKMKEVGAKNRVMTSLIGQGYYGTVTPPAIQRNILENPAWYTAYTPYQPEIAQGRLEALLNFQTMICDLTGLDVANASLLDEATAAAEAMTMAERVAKSKAKAFFVDRFCHPQTIAVIRTRAMPLGIEIIEDDVRNLDPSKVFGAIFQYPSSYGHVVDFTVRIATLHAAGAIAIMATDLLALCMLKEPGAMGADANAGSSDPLAYHRDSYIYASHRLRDPFGSLLKGRFVSDGSDKTPDIGSLDLVGVMWGDSDKFALCEDREGHGFVLRVGDPVQNGEVAGITRESLTIRQYFFGTSTSVILKLKPREGNSNGKNRRR